MAFLDLHFDTTAKRLVRGATDSGVFSIKELFQEDGLPIDLQLLRRASYFNDPLYEVLTVTGMGLMISVGSADSVLASQDVWSISEDGKHFEGCLELGTTGMNALADGAVVTLEVRVLLNGTTYYRTQQNVVWRKSVALAGAAAEPAVGTGITKEEANASYLPKTDVMSFTMISRDSSKRALIYLDNDGSLKARPIT